MEASRFVNSRDKLCKARHRGIITHGQFTVQMHMLFREAQVTRGFDDDASKAEEIYKTFVDRLEQQIEEFVS